MTISRLGRIAVLMLRRDLAVGRRSVSRFCRECPAVSTKSSWSSASNFAHIPKWLETSPVPTLPDGSRSMACTALTGISGLQNWYRVTATFSFRAICITALFFPHICMRRQIVDRTMCAPCGSRVKPAKRCIARWTIGLGSNGSIPAAEHSLPTCGLDHLETKLWPSDRALTCVAPQVLDPMKGDSRGRLCHSQKPIMVEMELPSREARSRCRRRSRPARPRAGKTLRLQRIVCDAGRAFIGHPPCRRYRAGRRTTSPNGAR